MIKKGAFVQIYKVVLSGTRRADNLPQDTAVVPFEMRIKGVLLQSANIGDLVRIKTATNRIESGILIKHNPHFSHNFGGHIPVLRDIREIILSEMEDIND